MDYKDLADLIYPNAKDISYYEEKYPRRNLEEGAIVTRYAPSPTGFSHIGGVFQALIAKAMAKKTNGVFLLRIEDTDQKREIENGIADIVSSLKTFDIDIDEEEALKYEPGDILPVFIFFVDGREVHRMVGEHSKEEILNVIDGIDS